MDLVYHLIRFDFLSLPIIEKEEYCLDFTFLFNLLNKYYLCLIYLFLYPSKSSCLFVQVKFLCPINFEDKNFIALKVNFSLKFLLIID